MKESMLPKTPTCGEQRINEDTKFERMEIILEQKQFLFLQKDCVKFAKKGTAFANIRNMKILHYKRNLHKWKEMNYVTTV